MLLLLYVYLSAVEDWSLSKNRYKVVLTTLEKMDRARGLYVKNNYVLERKSYVNISDHMPKELLRNISSDDLNLCVVHYMKEINRNE